MATTVANIYHLKSTDWRNDARYVYIGRANRKHGLEASIWANPYSMYDYKHLALSDNDLRSNVVHKFASYLEYNEDLLVRLPTLEDKICVCYCHPKHCHGHILASWRAMLGRLAQRANGMYESQRPSHLQTALDIVTSLQRGTYQADLARYTGQAVQQLDTQPIYIAIVGSRDYPNTQQIIDYVNALPDNSIIVSGGARGVDSIAEQAARKRGLEVIIYPAEWDKYGKSAGFRRNADIVAKCDKLAAFHHNNSKGTAHSIKLAQNANKQVEIYTGERDINNLDEWFTKDGYPKE